MTNQSTNGALAHALAVDRVVTSRHRPNEGGALHLVHCRLVLYSL